MERSARTGTRRSSLRIDRGWSNLRPALHHHKIVHGDLSLFMMGGDFESVDQKILQHHAELVPRDPRRHLSHHIVSLLIHPCRGGILVILEIVGDLEKQASQGHAGGCELSGAVAARTADGAPETRDRPLWSFRGFDRSEEHTSELQSP